ncbi:MAG: endonuclease/exonuclease/phosphatase family protein [Ignavibacteriales bacterium]|nr:endonuclease/exonuclease/phosphatase family protein [Ignavibacteriales bacterium]
MLNNMIRKFIHSSAEYLIKLLFIALLLNGSIATIIYSQQKQYNELKVMTFNIRYGTANDGENNWEYRKNNVVETIKNFNPDLFGLQEALQLQIDELLKQMPNYSYVGVGRDDGKSAGEHSCIFYLKDRFSVDSSSTFWFSETPDVIASKSWGNNITRICTWALFRDKLSGKSFYIFNLHLDHESQPSREKSSELLVRKISQKSLSVILTGDFNCGNDNHAIKTILSHGLIDSYRKLHKKKPNEGTFNSFKGETNGDKIDFIFVTKEFEVKRSEIVRTSYNGKYPSDHFPVTAEIKY